MTPNLNAQLHNILSGRTAFGAVGFGRMAFPRDPTAFNALTLWTLHGATGKTDEEL